MKQYTERYLNNVEKGIWGIIKEHKHKLKEKDPYVCLELRHHGSNFKRICVWDGIKHTYFGSLSEYQDYVTKLPEPPEA